jgi:hypothetical protein
MSKTKNNSRKNLRLNRETVRHLDDRRLSLAGGASSVCHDLTLACLPTLTLNC